MLAPGDEIEDTQGAVSLITLLMKFVGGDKGDPTGRHAMRRLALAAAVALGGGPA
jgi:hypothetical protein